MPDEQPANAAHEFTVQNPEGDIYRVVTRGDARQAIVDAQRASHDTRHTIEDWTPISRQRNPTDAPYVRKLDEHEKHRLLDIMELVRQSEPGFS